MKLNLTAFLLCFIYTACTGQSSTVDDTLYFATGKTMGGKREMIKGCAGELAQHGTSTNATYTCTCMLEAMARHYSYEQFAASMQNGEMGGELMLDALKPTSPANADVMACLTTYLQSNRDSLTPGNDKKFVDTEGHSEEYISGLEIGFLSTCESAASGNKDIAESGMDVTQYCTCVFAKLKNEGITMGQMRLLQDPTSGLYVSIIQPCLTAALQAGDAAKGKTKQLDIVGGKATEKVPLVSLAGLHNVKVVIGKVEKYFILDSGASETFISAALEEELLKDGAINKDDYLSSRKFLMANGEYVTCRRVKVHGIVLGNYTINNVAVAINEKSNSLLLLGKTVLNKFRDWSIDNKTDKLVLNR